MIYTIEEEREVKDGIYEAPLKHDNINQSTLNVYTGSKLTGKKITTYALSTPSLTPWKKVIKVFTNEPVIYISYETDGDTVEAEDMNLVQDTIILTQEALTTEEKRAFEAEKALAKAIEAEEKRAIQAEENLHQQLEAETKRAVEAENVLTENLNAEVERAANAENKLTENLEAEIERATKAETVLTENLEAETKRAIAAEEMLTNNLESEIERAKKAETVLTNELQSEVQRATKAETVLTENLQAEVTRATSAEAVLTKNLQEEVTRASNAETVLTKDLKSEIDRAKKSEQTITNAIETEVERATKAEESITSNLQAEVTRATNVEQQVISELQAEIQRATKAEQTLKGELTSEESRAKTAEAALEEKKVDKIEGKGLSTNDLTNELKNQYDTMYQNATSYTNQKIADLIGGAPQTLDTLKEVADAIQEHKEITDALDNAIGTKADQAELDSHTGNTTIHITSIERTNWNDANGKKHTHTNKTVLDGITEALITAWNSAVTHISDTVKHITSTERMNWNNAKTKADSAVQTIQINGSTQTKTNGVVNLPAYPSSISGNAETASKLKTARKIGNASFDGSTDISLSQIGAAATSHTHTDYANQNAFSNIKVGNTTIQADSVMDILTLEAGSNVTLTSDATNDKVTISATNTVYTHPTTSGNKHIPAGGKSGQILKWSADGTASWQTDNSLVAGGLTWNDLKGV